jgi:hypothetical protein
MREAGPFPPGKAFQHLFIKEESVQERVSPFLQEFATILQRGDYTVGVIIDAMIAIKANLQS